MRKQLRPFYTPEQLAQVYDHQYDHTRWQDHIERVEKTTQLLDFWAGITGSETVADLSCGDGAIVNNSLHPWSITILGDYVTTGPIEEALTHLSPVDMFVLSETLEHVEDPDGVVRQIRSKAKNLLLTTPLGEVTDENPEHYWGWDAEGVERILRDAGWTYRKVVLFTPPSIDYYTFQMWMCS